MRLKGTTTLVIGGSGGMGLGAASAAVGAGGKAVISSRSADKLGSAIERVREAAGVPDAGAVSAVACDLLDLDSIRSAIGGLRSLDHLVITAAPPRGVTDDEFFEGKFWGSKVAVDAAASRLPDTGSVTLVSGGMAVRPMPGSWAVTTAYSAVEALARAKAVELAPIRVNCIRPGLFDTGFWSDEEREGFAERARETIPLARAGSPRDFGELFLGLASSSFLTGQVITLDGGESLT